LKVQNGGIRKNIALDPRSQPSLYDGHVKRFLSSHFPPPVDPGLSHPDVAAQRVMDSIVKRTKMLQRRLAGK
jgi:hypothetical protein